MMTRRIAAVGLDLAARWLLALVFLAAGLPKLFDLPVFASMVRAYGILPPALVWPVAIVLPVLELVAVVLLILGKRSGLYLAGVLMLLFIGVLSYGVGLGLDIDCGCFGPEDPEHRAFAGLREALIRDVLLLVPLAFCLKYSYSTQMYTHGEQR